MKFCDWIIIKWIIKLVFAKCWKKLKIAGEKLEKGAKYFWKKLEESQNKNEKMLEKVAWQLYVGNIKCFSVGRLKAILKID